MKMKIWIYSILVSLGSLLVVLAIVLQLRFPSIMSSQLEKKLIIREDSPTLANFISPPIPIYMQFFFFNITNPKEILEGGKPKLVEIGPYTYLEEREKFDLNWTETTVEYNDNTTFFFDSEMSGTLTENDMITTLNPLLITLASKLDNPALPPFLHGIFEMIKVRFDLSPFITKKVGDLLFNGYREDLLLELAKYTNDPIHKTGRFGFFYPKNNTDGGRYGIKTGADGLENLQLITSWKGKPTLGYWPEDHCNMINGTTGSQFPQPIVPEKKMYLFSSDLCRSLHLTFEKKYEYGGLELSRFTLPYEVLANSEENECFCTDNFTCRASMVNLSPCRNGAPVIASTPHFYMGDEETVAAVDGLNPTKEYHETYIDLEPNTGVSFAAMKRIQISMPLRRYKSIPELANVKEVIIPLLWLNESAQVPIERARGLHAKLTKPLKYVLYVCIALFCIGVFIIVFFAILILRTNKKEKKDMKLNAPELEKAPTDYPKESDPLRTPDSTN
uniref:Lysosome membrane protein 2-like n=1 Tax=Hirondellea gigas TaxID=1518452 RepID=A0A2P2I2A7_9CRUS